MAVAFSIGGSGTGPIHATPSIFAPASTRADAIHHLSLFVLTICGIFLVVSGLLLYSALKFRRASDDDNREPPQIYGSNQFELAWTIIPILMVAVLFLATAQVIHAVQDAQFPPDTMEITAIGHQFCTAF